MRVPVICSHKYHFAPIFRVQTSPPLSMISPFFSLYSVSPFSFFFSFPPLFSYPVFSPLFFLPLSLSFHFISLGHFGFCFNFFLHLVWPKPVLISTFLICFLPGIIVQFVSIPFFCPFFQLFSPPFLVPVFLRHVIFWDRLSGTLPPSCHFA